MEIIHLPGDVSLLLTDIVSTQNGSIGCHGDKDYYATEMVGLLGNCFFFNKLSVLKVINRSAGKKR